MSCLSLSELSDSQIDAMVSDVRKRIALWRVTSMLNSLPAPASAHPLERGVAPDVAVAGNSLLEPRA